MRDIWGESPWDQSEDKLFTNSFHQRKIILHKISKLESTSDNLLRGSRKWLLFYPGRSLLQTQPPAHPGRPVEKTGAALPGWSGEWGGVAGFSGQVHQYLCLWYGRHSDIRYFNKQMNENNNDTIEFFQKYFPHTHTQLISLLAFSICR